MANKSLFCQPISRFLILLALLPGCAGNQHWATKIQWQDFTLDQTPTQSDYPDASAVVLLNEGKFNAAARKNTPLSVFKQKTIVKILNAEGKKYANIAIPYSSQSKVLNIKARTISPNGKITVLKKENIYDVNLYPNFVLYSDIRAKTFTFPAVDTGSILEYSFTKEINSITYWNNWVFQRSIPTQISRFSLKIPSSWEYQAQTYFVDIEPAVKKLISLKKNQYMWEMRNIPEFIPEPSMPATSRRLQRIEFSPAFIKDWQGIGNWYHNLADERMEPDPALQAFTDALLAGLTDEKSKLERIFNFVQQKIRYVSISIGIGSYQPHFAADIFENRYGDCKDMTTLIVAMARAAGLSAWPALISTYQNGAVDTLLVSQAQFNHAIACAQLPDSQLVWMDGTDKNCAFGKLPWYDQGCQVLLVQELDQAKFIKTPVCSGDQNVLRREWVLDLQKNGALTGTADFFYNGVLQQVERRLLKKIHPQLREQYFASRLIEMCPSAVMDSFKIANLENIKPALSLHFHFQVPDFVVPSQGKFILDGTILPQQTYTAFFPTKKRQFPVSLKFLEKNVDFITLHLPDQAEISYLPKEHLLFNEMGEYEIRYSLNENSLMFYRKFATKKQIIPVAEYADWRQFLQKAALCDRDKIIINPTQPKEN